MRKMGSLVLALIFLSSFLLPSKYIASASAFLRISTFLVLPKCVGCPLASLILFS
jgi:hypothetical protein